MRAALSGDKGIRARPGKVDHEEVHRRPEGVGKKRLTSERRPSFIDAVIFVMFRVDIQ